MAVRIHQKNINSCTEAATESLAERLRGRKKQQPSAIFNKFKEMKKLLILITFCALIVVYFYYSTKKNVYSQNKNVIEKEKSLVNCLKQNVKITEQKIQSEIYISSNEMLMDNIQFVKKFNREISNFQLCDKVFEIDSIVYVINKKNSSAKNQFIGQRCQKEIRDYNNALKSFFNSSIWIRNSLINNGEISKREYFEYNEYKLNDLKPSNKRAKTNSELDSLMVEGLKKK